MRIRTAWPVLLAMVGCGDSPPATTDDTTDDTVVVETDTVTDDTDPAPVQIPPEVTGTFGNVVIMHSNQGISDPPRTKVRALFTQEAAEVVSMAACVINERYCMQALPTSVDAPLDLVDADFSALSPDCIDAGETLSVGDDALSKYVRQSGVRWFYLTDLPSYPSDMIGPQTATLGGQWGLFDDVALDIPAPLAVTSPDPHDAFAFQPGNTITFTWVPTTDPADPPDNVYLIVDLPPLVRRAWLLEDTGTFTLYADDLGDLTQQAIGTVELVRMTEKVTDWGGNTLVGQVFSRQTWNASTVAQSCKSVLATNPGAASGAYMLQPDPLSPPQSVWCDMTTDGGGWTLVASASGTIDDRGVPYNADLASLNPVSNMNGVWQEARAVLRGGNRSDIRFACRRAAGNGAFDVDLSFYDTIWYSEMANANTDDQSCFNEGDGAGADPPPARQNNLTGASLPAGNPWNYGYLEGEDSCLSTDDFTVDFDDRGMDSNEQDGTDWGEDDGSSKCGTGPGAQYFVFMREP